MVLQQLDGDVLRQISQFLPENALWKVHDIHPIFFESWMKARYGSVNFERSDKQMKRVWAHLRYNSLFLQNICKLISRYGREDYVAERVSRVRIQPWLIQPRNKSCRSRTENFWNRFCMMLDPDHLKKQAEIRFQRRMKKDIDRVTSALGAMKRVEEYEITWNGGRRYHRQLFDAFLQPVLRDWAHTLLTLSIKLPPELLSLLVRVNLPRLENLEATLHTAELQERDIHNVLDGFIVFVHNTKDTLRSLSILSTSSSENLDLSRLFRLLNRFPRLRSASLSIPFDGGHLSDPTSFSSFLEMHRGTLQHLSLKASRCIPVHTGKYDPDCVNWIQRIIGSVHVPFPQLSSLELALRPLRAPLHILSDFLTIHSPTLESLILNDRILTLDDVQSIVAPFASIQPEALPLKRLKLRVSYLSPELLYLLASRLPRLRSLNLIFTDVVSDETRRRSPRKSEDLVSSNTEQS